MRRKRRRWKRRWKRRRKRGKERRGGRGGGRRGGRRGGGKGERRRERRRERREDEQGRGEKDPEMSDLCESIDHNQYCVVPIFHAEKRKGERREIIVTQASKGKSEARSRTLPISVHYSIQR